MRRWSLEGCVVGLRVESACSSFIFQAVGSRVTDFLGRFIVGGVLYSIVGFARGHNLVMFYGPASSV